MGGIKAVFFDIDNTLYSYDRAHAHAYAGLLEYIHEHYGIIRQDADALLKQCNAQMMQRLGECAAVHNRLIRFELFQEMTGRDDMNGALEMYHVYWDDFLEHMETEPGIEALLSALKRSGVMLGIGSNMTAYMQYRKLQCLGLLHLFDRIVISEETPAEKPSPAFFRICLEKAGCRPEECVFIGDSLRNDVLGSTACGMNGVWYGAYERVKSVQEEIPRIEDYRSCLREHEICLGDIRIPLAAQ